MFKQINLLFNAEQDKALTWAIYELGIESLIQNSPNPSGLSYISPIHPFYHVMIMHHIVHCIDCVSFSVAGICPL